MQYILILLLFQIPKDLIPPPGTVRLSENRFIDKQLVTYEGYYEYLDWLQRNQEEETYIKMLPKDTTILYKNQRLWKNKKYATAPIAGLEKDQMLAYCQWRSWAVNYMVSDSSHRTCNFEYWQQFDAVDPLHTLKITYQLPEKADLDKYPAPKELFWLNETTTQESYPRTVSKKISRPELLVFRCVAVYE